MVQKVTGESQELKIPANSNKAGILAAPFQGSTRWVSIENGGEPFELEALAQRLKIMQ